MARRKYTKQEKMNHIKSVLLVILGTFLLALGTAIFIIPFDLVTGGVSGIAIVLHKIIPVEFLTVDIWASILVVVLFFVGLFTLGKNFAIKTLVSTIFYPLFLFLCTKLVDPNVLNGFFYLKGYLVYGDSIPLISSIFGGVIVGAGCSVTFIGGGSTGGVDVFSFIITKYFIKRAKTSVVMFIVDALIIFSGIFVIKDFVLTLLGIVTAFIIALVIDKVFLGSSQAFVAHIVSLHYEEINKQIIEKMDRTSTLIEAIGGYSKEEKKVLMVSFSIREYATLTSIVHTIDKEAFMTINRAHEVNGEGWTR